MQTVNENVPTTRVVKLSELRTTDDISDQALLMGVQNGRGFKTTYGNIRNQIFQQVSESIKEQLKALDKKATAGLTSIDNKVDDVSSKMSENVLLLQRQGRKTQDELSELSTKYSSNCKNVDTKLSACQQFQVDFADKLNSLDVKTDVVSAATDQSIGIHIAEIKEEKKNLTSMFQTFKAEIENTIAALEKKIKNISKYVERNVKDDEQVQEV